MELAWGGCACGANFGKFWASFGKFRVDLLSDSCVSMDLSANEHVAAAAMFARVLGELNGWL